MDGRPRRETGQNPAYRPAHPPLAADRPRAERRSVVEIDSAVVGEVVAAVAGLELSGHGIPGHTGDHIEELEQPLGVSEDTARARDLVGAAAGHLQGEVEGLAEALGIGSFDGVRRPEPARLALEGADKDLAALLDTQVVEV